MTEHVSCVYAEYSSATEIYVRDRGGNLNNRIVMMVNDIGRVYPSGNAPNLTWNLSIKSQQSPRGHRVELCLLLIVLNYLHIKVLHCLISRPDFITKLSYFCVVVSCRKQFKLMNCFQSERIYISESLRSRMERVTRFQNYKNKHGSYRYVNVYNHRYYHNHSIRSRFSLTV